MTKVYIVAKELEHQWTTWHNILSVFKTAQAAEAYIKVRAKQYDDDEDDYEILGLTVMDGE